MNFYFILLRFNSNVHNFKEMTDIYKKCVRYFINHYLPNNDYNLQNKTIVPEFI